MGPKLKFGRDAREAELLLAIDATGEGGLSPSLTATAAKTRARMRTSLD